MIWNEIQAAVTLNLFFSLKDVLFTATYDHDEAAYLAILMYSAKAKQFIQVTAKFWPSQSDSCVMTERLSVEEFYGLPYQLTLYSLVLCIFIRLDALVSMDG